MPVREEVQSDHPDGSNYGPSGVFLLICRDGHTLCLSRFRKPITPFLPSDFLGSVLFRATLAVLTYTVLGENGELEFIHRLLPLFLSLLFLNE